jgi:ABC-type polysaccharide/polyol phosphate export permease
VSTGSESTAAIAPGSVHMGELVEPNPTPSFFGGLTRMARDVRRHRHLVANFISRDVRLKFRDSKLGYVWSILEPLLMTGVYVVLFTVIAGKPEPLYPLWVVIGVITWGYFGKALTGSLTALTGNEGIIKQVYFPRILFAVNAVGSGAVISILSLFVAVPFLVYHRIAPTPSLLLIPAGLVVSALFAMGLGLSLACLNVVFRDTEFIMRFLVRAGFYLSPVMWTFHMVPKSRASIAILLNPMAVPITMVRNGIDGSPLGISSGWVIYSIAVSAAMFVFGVCIFQRYEAGVVRSL